MAQRSLRGHRAAIKVRRPLAISSTDQRVCHRLEARKNLIVSGDRFGVSGFCRRPTKAFPEVTASAVLVVNEDWLVTISNESSDDVFLVRGGKLNRVMEYAVIHTEREKVADLLADFAVNRVLMEYYGDIFRGSEVAGKLLDRRIIGQGLVAVASQIMQGVIYNAMRGIIMGIRIGEKRGF